MANLNLKHSTRPDREAVEKHVKNSLEYVNPNLKRTTNLNFPQITEEDKKTLNSQQFLEKVFRTFKHNYIMFSGWRIDADFKGFFLYVTGPEGKRDINDEKRVEIISKEQVLSEVQRVCNEAKAQRRINDTFNIDDNN